MLSRLDRIVAADPETLANELRGDIFRRGEVATRLREVGVTTLLPEDQRMLGIAVGQRSSAGTFVVREDGLQPAADSASLEEWPADYRAGLTEGVFLDRNGFISVQPALVDEAVRAVAPLHDHGTTVLRALLGRLNETEWAPSVPYDNRPDTVVALHTSAESQTEVNVRSVLHEIASRLASL